MKILLECILVRGRIHLAIENEAYYQVICSRKDIDKKDAKVFYGEMFNCKLCERRLKWMRRHASVSRK